MGLAQPDTGNQVISCAENIVSDVAPDQGDKAGSIPGSALFSDAKLVVRPTTLRHANDVVAEHHRHNGRTARNGGKFAISARVMDIEVGVAIVGNPVSATYMDGETAEILRVCTVPGAPPNTNSFLSGAARRVWFAMGGQRIFTYTLKTESGASLRAAGWVLDGETTPHDQHTWGKKDHLTTRISQPIYSLVKLRWVSRVTKGGK